MMRKLMACLCLLCVACLPLGALSQEVAEEASPVPTEPVAIGVQEGSHLTISTDNEMTGYFATELFGSNTADIDVRSLLHDYDTVASTQFAGLSVNNTVVTDYETAINENGENIYSVQIAENLTYNDGTPITIYDYLFSYLLGASKELTEIGGTTLAASHIEGFDDYHRGETEVLSGVRILSEYGFEMQMNGGFLPYFYGLELVSVKPLPIAIIAPGCEVRDDGDGIYLAAADDAGDIPTEGLPYTPGVFSSEMLQETLLNPETGYVFLPLRTAGPYQLESVDMEAQVVEFTLNENYQGNYNGKLPHIERLTFRWIPEEEVMDALASGKIDIANKVMEENTIREGMAQVDTLSLQMASYPRSGFGFIAFACEQSPTDSVYLRRALAMALDKDTLVEEKMPLTASRVYGYYGLGQWIAAFIGDMEEEAEAGAEPVVTPEPAVEPDPDAEFVPELDGGAAEEEAEGPVILIDAEELEETLNVPLNLEEAAQLLAEDGWTINEQGEAFVPGVDTLRWREAEGGLEPLRLRMAAADGDDVPDYIMSLYEETLPQLGVELTLEIIPYGELIAHYYRWVDRTYDMFFLGSNFSYIYDPYYDFHTEDQYQGMINTSGLRDSELMQLAMRMRNTEPLDFETYSRKWMDFQERFVELMPMIPLYSNSYTDFYRQEVQAYRPDLYPSWAIAIVDTYLK